MYLKVYSLTVYHSDDSTCKDIDEFVDALGGDEEGNGKRSNRGIVAAVIILIIFVICVFGVCWWYKKNNMSPKGRATFDDGIETPEINSDNGKDKIVAEEEKPVKTGGYDMERIDIEKDIEDADKNTED